MIITCICVIFLLIHPNMSLLAGVIVFWLLARIVCRVIRFVLSTFIAIVIIALIINYLI